MEYIPKKIGVIISVDGNVSQVGLYNTTNDVDTAKYVETRLGNKTEKSMKISVEGEGTATFDAISFPAPGKYSYELKEDVLNLGGYRFDKSRYQVVFTVEEDPEEALKLLVKKLLTAIVMLVFNVLLPLKHLVLPWH